MPWREESASNSTTTWRRPHANDETWLVKNGAVTILPDHVAEDEWFMDVVCACACATRVLCTFKAAHAHATCAALALVLVVTGMANRRVQTENGARRIVAPKNHARVRDAPTPTHQGLC